MTVEWAGGRGEPNAPPRNAPGVIAWERETELDDVGVAGTPAIVFDPGREGFSALRLREQTDYLVDVVVPTTKETATAALQVRAHWPFHDRLARYYRSDPPRRWRETAGGLNVSGCLNFRSHVGIADLSLDGSGELLVDVVPTKIGFLDDYPALLNAIGEHVADLVFRAEGPTFAPARELPRDRATLLSVLMQVRRAMSRGGIGTAIEELLHSPGRALVDAQARTPIALARDIDPVAVASAPAARLGLQSGGVLAGLFDGRTPTVIPTRVKHETVDTAENRYVKHFLAELALCLYALRNALRELTASAAHGDVTRWLAVVGDWQSHPLWAQVGEMTHWPSNSQVLQRSAVYRQILNADMALQLASGLRWEGGFSDEELMGDLKPVDKLYEYWCFFELWRALEAICGPAVNNANVSVKVAKGLSVTLKRGAESELRFRCGGGKADAVLFYNRTFRRSKAADWENSYSTRLAPDFSIRVAPGGKAAAHWLHFDAKYRLDFAQWRADASVLGEASGDERVIDSYKNEDLLKMHTYRDALLGSRGSYVLFPGQSAAEDIMLRYPGARYPWAAFSIPSVGAIQLRPGSVSQRSTLVSVIRRILSEIVSGPGDYQEETGFFSAQ